MTTSASHTTHAPSRPGVHDTVLVKGGAFLMGSDSNYPEEAVAHTVRVGDFRIDRYQVTNRQFARFVAESGYVTVAERPLDPTGFPGAPPQNLVPGSMVFTMTTGPVDLRHLSQWWTWTPGAAWSRPFGPDSGLTGRGDQPVVHIAFEDAQAYADWAGKALPTEAEWEYAARGGLDGTEYTWGTQPEQPGQRLANYWHGHFPWRPDNGYGAVADVGSYPANGYGLHDMAGNVWEWTCDWYTNTHRSTRSACCVPDNPRGGTAEDSYDSAQPQYRVPRKVVKGGSFLCADSYCRRYRPAARRGQPIDTGMSHIGFRCIDRTA